MEKNLEAVKALARDLRRESPRDVADELGGFEGAARCIDKCRATLVGWQGEYVYGSPMDQKFLSKAGIGANELKVVHCDWSIRPRCRTLDRGAC